jgi:hypothetical protein
MCVQDPQEILQLGTLVLCKKMLFVPILRTEFNYGPNPTLRRRSSPCPRSQWIAQGNLPAYQGIIANGKSWCYPTEFMET